MGYLKTFLFLLYITAASIATAQDTLQKQHGNMLYLNAAYFHNEGVHECFGVGVGFEKMLDKNEVLSANIPIVIGLPGSDNRIGFLQVSQPRHFYSSFSAAPGFKFYAGKKSNKVRYALGVSVFFEAGRENRYADGEQPNIDNPVQTYSVFGYMLPNSVRATLARRIDIGFTFGTGMAAKHRKGTGYSFNWGNEYGPDFLGWLMLSAGYEL